MNGTIHTSRSYDIISRKSDANDGSGTDHPRSLVHCLSGRFFTRREGGSPGYDGYGTIGSSSGEDGVGGVEGAAEGVGEGVKMEQGYFWRCGKLSIP